MYIDALLDLILHMQIKELWSGSFFYGNSSSSIAQGIHHLFSEAVKSGDGVDFSGDSVTENGSVIISHDVSDDYKTEDTSNVITTTAEISPPQQQPIGRGEILQIGTVAVVKFEWLGHSIL